MPGLRSASTPPPTGRRSWSATMTPIRPIGPFVQVSRLGNPLFNEVIMPMGREDEWNTSRPADDDDFAMFVRRPELADLLPVLYPGVFPNLAALDDDRADLVAILLTGIPAGLVPSFQNFTRARPADLLRLNLAIPSALSPSVFGLLAATWPVSRTAVGCSTTWSRSSCAP